MPQKVKHEGDSHHPNHGDYLRARGELIYEGAYLSESVQSVLQQFTIDGTVIKPSKPLGTYLRQLAEAVAANPEIHELPTLLKCAIAVKDRRDDILHPLAITGGAVRFNDKGSADVARSYFSVGKLDDVRDEIRKVSSTANTLFDRVRAARKTCRRSARRVLHDAWANRGSV